MCHSVLAAVTHKVEQKDFAGVCCTKSLYQGGNPNPPLDSRKPMMPPRRDFRNQEYLNSEEC